MRSTSGSARTEAERLVATVLAMAAGSGSGHGSGSGLGGGLGDLVMGALGQAAAGAMKSGGWSTGSPECCVCPVCKIIAGLRDPSPQMTERLATGAGDFAAGVASLMRSLSEATAERTGAQPSTEAQPPTDAQRSTDAQPSPHAEPSTRARLSTEDRRPADAGGPGVAAGAAVGEAAHSGTGPGARTRGDERASHWRAATAADRVTPPSRSVWADAATAVDHAAAARAAAAKAAAAAVAVEKAAAAKAAGTKDAAGVGAAGDGSDGGLGEAQWHGAMAGVPPQGAGERPGRDDQAGSRAPRGSRSTAGRDVTRDADPWAAATRAPAMPDDHVGDDAPEPAANDPAGG